MTASNWTRDRNCFLARHPVDPARREAFVAEVERLLVFAKPFYDRGCAFAFQGWARDPDEWVAIASWDDAVVAELRATAKFQRINQALLDCCTGPVVLENFAGMLTDRAVFDAHPAGRSAIHLPGRTQELLFR